MTQIVVGAGMAGLLAANLLRDLNPVILEKQPSLPNNHSAVLRFGSPLIGEVLGINFKRVRMLKATLPWRNPVADALSYAHKVTGTYRSDRSIPSSPVEAERWIAPPDLIDRMAERVTIHFDRDYDFSEEDHLADGKVISTIPMPVLMDKLNYPGPRPKFRHVDGVNIRAKVKNCEAHVTLYVPDPEVDYSRVTLTGDELILEFPGSSLEDFDGFYDVWVHHACDALGIKRSDVEKLRVIPQKYAKIDSIDEEQRRTFIFWSSTLQGMAYSLGRFACWRPGLMLDHLVKDVRLIESWIRKGQSAGMDQSIHAVTSWR
jgi:hypothetical protein